MENTLITDSFQNYMVFIYLKLYETPPPETTETWLKVTKDSDLPPSGEEEVSDDIRCPAITCAGWLSIAIFYFILVLSPHHSE